MSATQQLRASAPPHAMHDGRRPAHMLAISRLTRSSTDRNGSLHSTVRCAWSLSLRCTQSTVKSRPGFLCGADELAAQLGPGGLRRGVDRGFDLLVGGDPGRQTLALQQVEHTAAALDVVVGQVELG